MTRVYYFVLTLAFAFCTSISSAQVPTGTPPFGSFGGGPDIINLANLNSHWDVPVFAKAGRGGFNFTYDLIYDSSVWYPAGASGNQSWQPVGGFGWAGQTEVVTGYVGSAASYSQTQQYCGPDQGYMTIGTWTYSGWVYYDAFGAPHSYNSSSSTTTYSGCGNNYSTGTGFTETTGDGSGYTLNVNEGCAPCSVMSIAGKGLVSPYNSSNGIGTATDRNGNQISVDSSGHFTDTLGTTALTVAGSAPNPVTFTYTAPSGGSASYSMKYTTYNVQTKFGCGGIAEYGPTSASLVSEIDLPDGSKYSFTYEGTPGVSGNVTGRLASVALPTGGTISYGYTGGSNGISCADGSAATLTRTTPDGTWTYAQAKGTGAASTTTVTDPQGNVTTIQFQGIYETQRVVSGLLTTNTCYNTSTSPCTGTAIVLPITQRAVIATLSSNLQSEHVDFINTYGLPTEADDYDYGSGAPGARLRKTTIGYASLGNGIVSMPSSVTVYNGAGTQVAQTNYNYDETTPTATSGTPQHVSVSGLRGNLTSIHYPAGGLTSHSTYYDTGTVSTTTDVNGATTTYTYGACGNSFPTGVAEPLNMARSMTWDTNCNGGVMTSVTDENNQVTSTTYNDPYFWRPASVTDATSAVTNFCYGLVSNGTCTINPNQVESTLTFNSNNSTSDTLTTVDGLGRVHLKQTRQAPSSSSFDTVENDYDALGRPSRVTLPYVGTAGQTNSSAPARTTTYDPLSRPSLITDAGGGSATYVYPQNDVTVTVGPAPTGENTKSRQLEYDALGRLTSVCEITSASGSGACSQNSAQTGFWTQYTYNAFNDLTGVTQNAQSGSTQTRSYSFDAMRRLTSEANPESGTTTYTFDTDSTCGTSNGDQVKRVDAVGNTVCFSHDALHRVTSVTYSGPYASNTPNKYLVYDSATVNSVAMVNVKSRLAEAYTATSQTGTKITDEGFSYSTRGELTDIYQLTPHSSSYYHVSQTYWPHRAPFQLSGNIGLPTIQYGGTIGSTVGLDGEGRITQVSASSGQNPVTSVSFNASSFPTQVNFGSGDSDIFAYDANTLRMTQYQFNVNGQSATGTLTWNANSTLQQLVVADPFNSTNNQTCNYSHDDLMRLTSANCGSAAAQTFSFDVFGNISKSGSPYSFQPTYSSSTNRITSLPNFTPTYDNNGNVTNDSNHTYAWDADGNSVTVDGVGLTFDALDRAVEKNNSGTYTEIVYAPTGAKLALMGGTNLQTAFVSLPGQAQAVYTSSGLSYYRHSDWLGSSRLSSTPTGPSATPGTGSATVNGSEQSIPGSNATPGTGSVTINGGEQHTSYTNPCCHVISGKCQSCIQTVYDTGTVSITVNGFTKTVSYGQGSTTSSIASALATAFNGDTSSPVSATASSNVVSLTSYATGTAANYSLSASSATTSAGNFSTPSFSTSPSGSTLTGGSNAVPTIYDSGAVWVTVNGTQYSTSYGQGSSTTSLASALAGVINANSTIVTASTSGATVSLTATTNGASTNYSLSSGSSTSQPSSFSQPSFTVSVSGAALTGGANGATTTMYADTAYAPFGEAYAQAGASDLSFTGQNQDTVSGDYDFLAREYSMQGRWPSPDPAGLAAVDPTNPQSWDRYAYVANSPLNYTDPSGLIRCPYAYMNCSLDENGLAGGGGACTADGVSESCGMVFGLLLSGAGNLCSDPSCSNLAIGATLLPNGGAVVVNGNCVSSTFNGQPLGTNCTVTGMTVLGLPQDTAWLETKVFFQAVGRNAINEFKEGGCVNIFAQAFSEGGSSHLIPDLPAGSGVDDAIRAGAQAVAATYAVNNALTVPLRSSIYRGILARGEAAATGFLALDFFSRAAEGAITEGIAIAQGTCH